MHYEIEKEIARFESLFAALASLRQGELGVERLCEYGYLVTPRRKTVAAPPGKSIALALMGLTHGNELAGAAVIANLASLMASGQLTPGASTAFFLGNPAAGRENKRFIDRDLNRSFGRKTLALGEERRAAELAAALKDSAYFLDYHQVSRPTDRAFFIFPYAAASLAFARAIAPRQTIVTHWGKPFSSEGMCSDEFVNAQGGVGLSLELGQNGFDPYQIAAGVEAGIWAMRAVTRALEDGLDARAPDPYLRLAPGEEGPIFTWAEILPWPEGSYVELVDDLSNFKLLEAGAIIGKVDGQSLSTQTGGRVLFPKYLTRTQQQQMESRPTELLRLMRPITVGELPS